MEIGFIHMLSKVYLLRDQYIFSQFSSIFLEDIYIM